MSCSSSGSSWSSSPGLACSPARPARASRSCSMRLGLALGSRADTGLVRAGQDGASVSRRDRACSRDHPAHALLAEQGIEIDRGEPLIVRRTLKSDGGSRAFVGGGAVPAGLLRDVGALAVEIHGQHDDRGLLNPKGHRALARRLRQARHGRGRRRLGRGDADRSRAGARRAPKPPRPSATANGSSMPAARSRRWRPRKARRPASPKSARRCRPALKAGESLTGSRRAARRVGRRARPAAPGGAADRARRGRPSAARRSAGVARPRA